MATLRYRVVGMEGIGPLQDKGACEDEGKPQQSVYGMGSPRCYAYGNANKIYVQPRNRSTHYRSSSEIITIFARILPLRVS